MRSTTAEAALGPAALHREAGVKDPNLRRPYDFRDRRPWPRVPRGDTAQTPRVPGQNRLPRKRQQSRLCPRPQTPRPTSSRHGSAPGRRHFVAFSKREGGPARNRDPQGPAGLAGSEEEKRPRPPKAPPEARRSVDQPNFANVPTPRRPIGMQRPGSDGAEVQ